MNFGLKGVDITHDTKLWLCVILIEVKIYDLTCYLDHKSLKKVLSKFIYLYLKEI